LKYYSHLNNGKNLLNVCTGELLTEIKPKLTHCSSMAALPLHVPKVGTPGFQIPALLKTARLNYAQNLLAVSVRHDSNTAAMTSASLLLKRSISFSKVVFKASFSIC
jgi:hypothetical protein